MKIFTPIEHQNEITVCENGLTIEAIRSIFKGETLIARVANFSDPGICPNLADGLQKAGYDDYLNAPMVGRIGMSFFETGENPDIVRHYFDTAILNIEKLRTACAPYQCPMDIFRCVIDEIWPAGGNLQTLSGQKMFAGLSRNMRPTTPLLAHHDIFSRLAPHAVESNSLLTQLAVNVYIDVPEIGGELIMWRDEISDKEFLKRRGSKYGMDLDLLGEPDITIKPKVGELILFNARKLHAVKAGEGSDRLTVSCFLGYRGEGHPLTIWS